MNASPFVENGEISRLLSLSGSATPRSILSKKSSSAEQMKNDLQEILLYIDGLTFDTPYKRVSMDTPVPPMTTSHVKPPLFDRTNTQQRHFTSGQKPREHIPSARDPTPSKPKEFALDLLRENLVGLSLLQSSPLDDSSLIVEMSHSTIREEEPHVLDPPIDDSKIWTSPPRRRVAMDPEPTQESNRDDSILLGTAFAKDDLMPRTERVAPIKASWATMLHGEMDGTQASANIFEYHSADEPYVTSSFPEAQVAPDNDPFHLNLPTTPAAVGYVNLDEVNQHRPQTPKDAKEWLQTAHIALQEARAERDAARQWARDMREAVQKWAEEQRKLIRCETSTRIDALEESERQVRLQTQALQKLESLLQELHHDFQATQSQRQASESHLAQLILDQQERIRELSQQLTSMEQTVSEGINSQANRLTPKSELSSQHAFPKFVDRPSTTSSQKSKRSTSSRVRKTLPEGNGHVIVYSNGVEKEVHNDGTTVIRFTNGDVETTFPGGATVAYLHAAEQVLQVTNRRDGSVLLEYPNGQIERHYSNGVKAILFPDGTKAKISADGKVETYHRI